MNIRAFSNILWLPSRCPAVDITILQKTQKCNPGIAALRFCLKISENVTISWHIFWSYLDIKKFYKEES